MNEVVSDLEIALTAARASKLWVAHERDSRFDCIDVVVQLQTQITYSRIRI